MLIGIDAHSLEKNRTGVGRVLFNLVKVWGEESHCEELRSSGATKPSSAESYGRAKQSRDATKQDYSSANGGNNSGLLRPLADSRARNDGCFPKFILYFKDEIPVDMPKAENFEFKLLNVKSTAKFIHWDLARAAKRDKIDVLFCPGYVAPICYKGKIALTLHDIIYEAHPEWFHWQSPADKILLKWVSKKSAQKASVIFACSEHTKREIKKYFKVPEEKIAVAELAVDEGLKSIKEEKIQNQDIYSFLGNKSLPTSLYKGGENSNFIFYAGSIFDRRHLPEIIGAFSRLAKENQGLQFLISGKDHTNKKNIDSLIETANKKLKRSAILRVDFAGDSDLRLLYGACAFFIYLSDYEGFGLPPLEAMSLGAPVITSDSTSLKEVAGNAALLVENNSDEEEIYQAMKHILEDSALRELLTEKGRKQAEKFSWKKCAGIVLEAMINHE